MRTDFKLYENIDAELLEKAYNEDNYLIEYSESKENLVVIYFSSHGIYRENTNEIFNKEIKIKNRFEWYKIRIKRASKHIFMRDILKQFYEEGINIHINSMDKVIEFLKKETMGMRIITVGGSAGGYMALLVGTILKAETIFTFSPILKLDDYPINSEQQNHKKYQDIIGLIKNTKSYILYHVPEYSKNDIEQLALLEDSPKTNLNIYRYKSNLHGGNMRRKGLKGLINSSPKFLSFVNKYMMKGKPHKYLMKFVFGLRYLLYLLE